MRVKSKGINAERELIHLFWKHGWAAIRTAGSGSNHYPSPDIIAGNAIRRVALECKVTKEIKQYLTKKEVTELQEYSKKFGAESWIAVKFDHVDWFFVPTSELECTGESFALGLEDAKMRGLQFEELIGNNS
ncbi:Holliday junction resolvase [Candidatus Woesearchaeota archaeon]|nr:Holliday junction resolvase [Candidatus Woesearchaeota archaeon]